jgi:hypothetical protein
MVALQPHPTFGECGGGAGCMWGKVVGTLCWQWGAVFLCAQGPTHSCSLQGSAGVEAAGLEVL